MKNPTKFISCLFHNRDAARCDSAKQMGLLFTRQTFNGINRLVSVNPLHIGDYIRSLGINIRWCAHLLQISWRSSRRNPNHLSRWKCKKKKKRDARERVLDVAKISTRRPSNFPIRERSLFWSSSSVPLLRFLPLYSWHRSEMCIIRPWFTCSNSVRESPRFFHMVVREPKKLAASLRGSRVDSGLVGFPTLFTSMMSTDDGPRRSRTREQADLLSALSRVLCAHVIILTSSPTSYFIRNFRCTNGRNAI